MTHLRIGLIVATILLIVACTAKLKQNSNSKSDNTKKEVLATVSVNDNSIKLEDLIYHRSSIISKIDNYGMSYYYYFDTSKSNKILKLDREHFFETHRNLFSIPETNVFKFEEIQKHSNNLQIHYIGYYKGVKAPIGASINMTNDSSITNITYSIFTPNANFDVLPRITEREAFKIAVEAMPNKNFIWEEPWRSRLIAQATKKHSDSEWEKFLNPIGKLLITIDERVFPTMPCLAYQFSIKVTGAYPHPWHVEVSAKDGSIIRIKDTFAH